MIGKKTQAGLSLAALGSLLLTNCGGDEPSPTRTPTATPYPPAATASPTPGPTPTTTPYPTPSEEVKYRDISTLSTEMVNEQRSAFYMGRYSWDLWMRRPNGGIAHLMYNRLGEIPVMELVVHDGIYANDATDTRITDLGADGWIDFLNKDPVPKCDDENIIAALYDPENKRFFDAQTDYADMMEEFRSYLGVDPMTYYWKNRVNVPVFDKTGSGNCTVTSVEVSVPLVPDDPFASGLIVRGKHLFFGDVIYRLDWSNLSEGDGRARLTHSDRMMERKIECGVPGPLHYLRLERSRNITEYDREYPSPHGPEEVERVLASAGLGMNRIEEQLGIFELDKKRQDESHMLMPPSSN